MRKVKISLAVLKSDFAGWIVNCKLYIVAILLIIFSLDNYAPVFEFAKNEGYRVTPFLFPFLFTHPFMHLFVFTLVILLFSDAPFTNKLQLLMMTRSGKRAWYVSQVMYLIICSVVLTAFLIAVPIIRNFSMIVFKNDWGKVWTSLSTASTVNPSSYFGISHYSPMEAEVYTAVAFGLIVIFIGMIIMLCNTALRNKSIGIAIAAIFVILDWMADITDRAELLWVSPVSWINIAKTAYSRDVAIPSANYTITVLFSLNILLMIALFGASSRRDVMSISEEA